MNFGENLKNTRMNKKFTPETVAERLKVQVMTVLSWEKGETVPDLKQLPMLANLFGISTDELLGYGKDIEDQEVEEILNKMEELDEQNRRDEMRKVIEDGLAKYPGNFKLMAEYVYTFQFVAPDKAIKVGMEVLEKCTDDKIRGDVRTNIIYAYKNKGNNEKVRELADGLPSYFTSRQDILTDCLSGTEKLKHVQDVCVDLAYEFWYAIRQVKGFYDTDKRIDLFQKSNAIYDAIYENDTMPIALMRKMRNFQAMAEISLSAGREEDGFTYMSYAAECAKFHDKLPRTGRINLTLFNLKTYEEVDKDVPFEELKKRLANDFRTGEEYARVRSKDRFNQIMRELV